MLKKCVLVCAAAVACLLHPAAQAVMTTPGQVQITDSGTFNYQIPITVPPGTAGVEPKVTLNLSSHSGDGIVGYGGGIGGLSSVTRCPQTLAQDGVRGTVNFDSGDRYCLDGQRLIVISGIYGANGAEYRTELDSSSKVISYGQTGNGPAWFKVWTKAGEVTEYGNTVDSFVEAQGKASARVWALNRVTDTKSNYLTFSYIKDSANGTYAIDEINYTGNTVTGLAPNAKVKFIYETRPDIIPTFQAGSLIKQTQRLSYVRTFLNSSQIKQYAVTYGLSPATNRSRVSTITECSGSLCLPPVTFTWTGSLSETAPHYVSIYATDVCADSDYACYNNDDKYRVKYPDINGDGRSDLCFRNRVLGITCYLAKTTGTPGWDTNNPITPGLCGDGYSGTYGTCNDKDNHDLIFYADVNGDGKADLIYRADEGIRILFSTGSGFTNQYITGVCANNSSTYGTCNDADNNYSIRATDVNGDGRADICYRSDSGIRCLLSTGNGLDLANPIITSICANGTAGCNDGNNWDTITYIDMNGDGKADMVYRDDLYGIRIWFSNGTSFVNPYSTGICADGSNGYALEANNGLDVGQAGTCNDSDNHTTIRFPDVNGDGLHDVCYRADEGIRCYLFNGVTLDTANPIITNICANGSTAYGVCNDGDNWNYISYYADVNGDGLSDLVYRSDQGIQIWYSTGTSFINRVSTTICANNSSAYQGCNDGNNYGTIDFVDVDGDGLGDLVYRGDQGVTFFPGGSNSQYPDLLQSVNTGLGYTTTVSYMPITDTSVYTRDSDGTYPIVDLQYPMYVVSTAKSSNGIGQLLTTTHRYGGLKADQNGRGSLGFRWAEATEADTDLVNRAYYRQDWPYIGLTSQSQKLAPAGSGGPSRLLNQRTHTLGCLNPVDGTSCIVSVGKRYFPYVSQTVEQSWDLNGVAMPSLTSTFAYDNYGNNTQLVLQSSDGYSKTTTNTYTNDTTNWFLGRLTKAVVTSFTP